MIMRRLLHGGGSTPGPTLSASRTKPARRRSHPGVPRFCFPSKKFLTDLNNNISTAKRRVEEDNHFITSFTVCIVDKSGSMKKSDVAGHRTRARAVYFAMGDQYLAPFFNREGESHTDLITVIEMRETPTVGLIVSLGAGFSTIVSWTFPRRGTKDRMVTTAQQSARP